MQTPDRRPLVDRLGSLWITYIKGQFLLSLIIGGMTWTVSSAIGLSWAGILGVTAGIFETIPSLGPVIATVPAVIVALWKGSSVISVENWVFALIVLGVYVAIQQIGSLLIEPRVMGKRLNLPPLAVLLTVILGAALGGIIGAYLAVPVLASLVEIVQFLQERPRGDVPPAAE